MFKTITRKQFESEFKCNIGDKRKIFKVGDIIHYYGNCYDWYNFYARIDKITPKSMTITKLDKVEGSNYIYFYLTDNIKKNLTNRPIYLLNL